jgi:hypothetical protein
MDVPVSHVHPEKIEQLHHEGQVPRDVVENETVFTSGGARELPNSGRESSLDPGERERNFCTMVYFWKDEMKV